MKKRLKESDLEKMLTPEYLKSIYPNFDFTIREQPSISSDQLRYDMELIINFEGTEIIFAGIVKASGFPKVVKQMLERKGMFGLQQIYIAPYFSNESQRLFMERRANFMDLSGNIYINIPSEIYICRLGSSNKFSEEASVQYPFSSKSSRIVRALLENPLKTWSVGEIAKETNISIGLASKMLSYLDEMAFITQSGSKKNRRIKLLAGDRLLDAWAQAYEFRKNKVTQYYIISSGKDETQHRIIDYMRSNPSKNIAFTRASGASYIAPFLRYHVVDAYADEPLVELLSFLENCREVDSGANLRLIKPYDEGVFQFNQNINDRRIVGNIQLYIDLYKYPQRGQEQAEFLRREKIKF